MVRWLVRLVLHGGPIELFLIPASAPKLMQRRLRYVLSCLWDGAYKRTLAAAQKVKPILRQQVSSFANRMVIYSMFDAI